MIALLFEVQIKEGHTDRYLELAASLKPSLDAMGGCLFLDRFKSLTRKNLVLSYQIWQDEGSLVAWRVNAKHHGVQEMGRDKGVRRLPYPGRASHSRERDRASPTGGLRTATRITTPSGGHRLSLWLRNL